MKRLMLTSGLAIGLAMSLSTGAMADSIKKQIVVMDFGALDTITELKGNESVIGLPQGNRPEYLDQYNNERYFNTGGMKSPDVELIQSKNPDYIITSPRQGSFVEALSAIADTHEYRINGEDYLNSVKKEILNIGKKLGKQSDAAAAWDKLEKNINENHALAEKSDARALVILHNDGKLWISTESGFGNFVHNVVGVKKADTIAKEDRKEVDEAYLKLHNPDIIYIIDRSDAIGNEALDLAFFDQEQFKSIDAVQNKQVIRLNSKLWYLSGNGLQSIQMQMDEVIAPLKKTMN